MKNKTSSSCNTGAKSLPNILGYSRYMIFDLKETSSIIFGHKGHSYSKMDFGGGDDGYTIIILYYNMIKADKAENTNNKICHDVARVKHHSYRHPFSESVMTLEESFIARTLCVTL